MQASGARIKAFRGRMAWIDFFNGVSTPEVERLDRLLGVTPLVVGDLILVEVVQGFRHERDVATASCAARGSR